MTHHSDHDARQKIWELIKDINIALMVTRDLDGNMHARPMGTQKPDGQKTFDGTLWFMTYGDSPKVSELQNNPEVLLSYARPDHQSYVSVAGRAEIVRDQAKVRQFWHEIYRTWFPDGPDDPDIVLIKVSADSAEYWDAASSAIVYAYGYFKTRMTGTPPDVVGEHEKIAFHREERLRF